MPEADSPCVDVLLHLEKEAQHVLISSRARISIKPDFGSQIYRWVLFQFFL